MIQAHRFNPELEMEKEFGIKHSDIELSVFIFKELRKTPDMWRSIKLNDSGWKVDRDKPEIIQHTTTISFVVNEEQE